MSSGLLAYIKQYSLFEGVKGEAVSWRNNINQLYKNWCLVANLEQQLKTKDSINKFKCSLGVLKNAGSMINKSNQILDSFRNPEETIKVITNLAYSIDENGNILTPRNLIKITDLLGREIEADKLVGKTTLFYLYDDGSVEKRIILD